MIMKMGKTFFYLTMVVALMLSSIGCSSDDEIEGSEVLLSVDYYGTAISYEPLEEKDMPEWIACVMNEKSMMGLYRICVGTINDGLIYHFNLATDSSYSGHFYDKDGNPIHYECDFFDFISQIHDVKCIYYKRFTD